MIDKIKFDIDSTLKKHVTLNINRACYHKTTDLFVCLLIRNISLLFVS